MGFLHSAFPAILAVKGSAQNDNSDFRWLVADADLWLTRKIAHNRTYVLTRLCGGLSMCRHKKGVFICVSAESPP